MVPSFEWKNKNKQGTLTLCKEIDKSTSTSCSVSLMRQFCVKCVKGIIYKVIKLKTSFTQLLYITFKVGLFTQFIQP